MWTTCLRYTEQQRYIRSRKTDKVIFIYFYFYFILFIYF